jgi:xylan 1,4-beta-xylosidase
VVPTSASKPAALRLRHLKPGRYYLRVYRTGYRANDAYSAYLDMGAPKTLTPDQVGRLQALTRDLPETERMVTVGRKGAFDFSVPMRANDVVLVTLARAQGVHE